MAPVPGVSQGHSGGTQGRCRQKEVRVGSTAPGAIGARPGIFPEMLRVGTGGMHRGSEGVAPIPGVSCGHPGSPRGCPAPAPAGCFGTRVMAPVPGVSCVTPGMLRVGIGGMLWRGEGGTGAGAPGDHDGARGSPVGHSWPPKPFRLGGPSPLRTLGVPPAPPAVQGQELLPALGTLGGLWGILGGLGGDMGGH